MEDRYTRLCNLQAECEWLRFEDSVLLTNHVTEGNAIEASILLLEIIEDINTAVNVKLSEMIGKLND